MTATCPGPSSSGFACGDLLAFFFVEEDDAAQTTNALLETAKIAMSVGCAQMEILVRNESLAASSRLTESCPRLDTTTVFPSALTRAIPGAIPTPMVAT